MSTLQTEYEFFLPKGFVDDQGQVHRKGTMRLATARDELEPLRDPRVRDADDPFLTIIVLARVVTKLGSLSQVTPREIESLFAADLAYLQDVYGAINFGSPDDVADVIEDAEQRMREATQLARRVSTAAAATGRSGTDRPAKATRTRVVEVVVEDDEDLDDELDGDAYDEAELVDDEDDDLEVDGSDDTIDADALAARLQAQFGDDEDDEEEDVEPVPVPRRRRHVEEIGTRSGV